MKVLMKSYFYDVDSLVKALTKVDRCAKIYVAGEPGAFYVGENEDGKIYLSFDSEDYIRYEL